MQDAHSVISDAAAGHVEDLAKEMEVGTRRMYEILGKDNPYPKAKRLIRNIGKFNKHGVRQIKADMMSMFADVLEDYFQDVTAIDLHKEAFEAVDAVLQGKSAADQLKELRELIAVAEQKIEGITRLSAA